MRRIMILVVLIAFAMSAAAQTFQDFLDRVNSAPDSLRGAIVDSFMNAAGSFPHIEGNTLTHFIYRTAANSATVPGDANNWNTAAFVMIRISATDFWYYSREFESDARLDYKFFLNGSAWILDPLNPYTCIGGFGPNSELRMPQYVMPPEIAEYPQMPHGTLHDTLFYSSNMHNSRTVRVYTPAGYEESSEPYPVVLVHDGLEYVSLAKMDNVLDYLIAHQRIRPMISVFVPPVDRTREYAGDLMDEFTAFIVQELFPWLDARYRTLTDAQNRATLGASNGGNIALWLGIEHPEVFGNIAAQSSNVITSVSNRLQVDPQLALRFHLDLGTYDIPALIPLVRNLVQILQQRNYDYRHCEYHEGHSWGNWRAHIDNALEMFFPGDSATAVSISPLPELFRVLRSYPNPFNATTTISFTLSEPQKVRLEVFDVQGRLVATLVDSPMTAGAHEVAFDGRELSSGTYFCRLTSGPDMLTQKMTLLK
ncbi:MAG: alpha/beta hydrolase-fold protein [bacterium]